MATQADLDALDKAMNSGALRVSIAGKSVEYRSLDEMKRIRSDLAQELAASPTRRRILTTTAGDKGL